MPIVMHNGYRPQAVAAAQLAPASTQPHSIPLPHPAIESLPEFAGRIDSRCLQPGARHYNGSICRFAGRVFMAYRYERIDAVSAIGLCELDSEFSVIADKHMELPDENAVQYEDPRLCVIDHRLMLQFAHVRLGVPSICRQRMFVIGHTESRGFADLHPMREIPLPFGNIHRVEKNWSPFELPDGNAAIVYQQRPRTVLHVTTRAGFDDARSMPTPAKSTLSGRTPPIRLENGEMLEFVGGHVADLYRATRYWFGAQTFSSKPPHHLLRATVAPLAWGTEASPTIFSPRPRAGHPCCIFPSGAMLEGEHVIVSCGVNDSYVALLRYHVPTLLEKMEVLP